MLSKHKLETNDKIFQEHLIQIEHIDPKYPDNYDNSDTLLSYAVPRDYGIS